MNMAQSETKQCQNCKQPFTIEAEDFGFYEKIKVPPPTFCPECRLQRRLTFRNERALYKRSCDLCKRTIIGAYSEKAPFPVYCQSCWWSDKWDPKEYARGYDFSRSFFEQYLEFQNAVPRQHINNTASSTLINSEYTNCAGDLKNCYLIFGAMENEDCLYSHYINYSKDCVDNLYSIKNEHCYECIDIESCYNISFSHSCVGCRDSSFLFDCRNCSDCIGCVGLRNKSFHVLNLPYSKEDYFRVKEKLNLNNRSDIENFRKEYNEKLFLKFPRKHYHGQMNNGFSGDYIANSERTKDSFYVKNAKDCKYCLWCVNAVDVYDFFAWGDLELCYENVSGGYNMYNCRFCHTAWENRNVEYSSLCMTSADLFGCIGLRNASFCIMNKQYDEAGYRDMKGRIISQMKEMPYRDKRGNVYAYGELFPIEHAPFPYADTVAQERFYLSEQEIENKGYVQTEPRTRDYTVTKKPEDLPDSISETSDSILSDVIECAHRGACDEQCLAAFRITAPELQFYRKMSLPLPTLCHNCRHYQRLKQQNPLKLWHGKCQCAGPKSENGVYLNTAAHQHGAVQCPNEFETSYAPDRKEVVYCEQCYNAEVV
jgi:hypothetical protein